MHKNNNSAPPSLCQGYPPSTQHVFYNPNDTAAFGLPAASHYYWGPPPLVSHHPPGGWCWAIPTNGEGGHPYCYSGPSPYPLPHFYVQQQQQSLSFPMHPTTLSERPVATNAHTHNRRSNQHLASNRSVPAHTTPHMTPSGDPQVVLSDSNAAMLHACGSGGLLIGQSSFSTDGCGNSSSCTSVSDSSLCRHSSAHRIEPQQRIRVVPPPVVPADNREKVACGPEQPQHCNLQFSTNDAFFSSATHPNADQVFTSPQYAELPVASSLLALTPRQSTLPLSTLALDSEDEADVPSLHELHPPIADSSISRRGAGCSGPSGVMRIVGSRHGVVMPTSYAQ